MEGSRRGSSSSSPDSSSWKGGAKRAEEDSAEEGGVAIPSSTSDSSASSSTSSARSSKDQSFTAADSNSSSTTKSFVPCKVCGDKASGYHYGVTSCEGCKGFFRRSIQKKIEYRCLRDEKCLVIRLNRNRCQFCRFKKCLDVGMSRDSVRYGRVPKRTRERMEENRVSSQSDSQQSQAEQSMRDLESKELAIYDLTLTVTQAHHVNCEYTELRTRGLQRKPAIFSLSEFSDNGSNSPDSVEHQKITMWQQFGILFTTTISKMVEFAKKVPTFIDLTQDDQLLLLKRGMFEVWTMHVARNSNEGSVVFADGSYITRQQIELIFDYEFTLALFNFITSVNSMELNDSEIGLFSAIILCAPEREGVSDPKLIGQIQDRLIEALKVHIGKHHPGEPNTFPMLMMKLSELRALGGKHSDHLVWFRANWERISPQPLFAETFDIPMKVYMEDRQQQ